MARPSSAAITVDFSNVTSRTLVPEDDYDAEVSDCTIETSDNGNYLKWVFEVAEGEHAGAKIFHNTSLLPQSLWMLRNVLVSLGIEVPASQMQITPGKYVGKRCGISVAHREYQNKKRPTIVDFFAARSGGVVNDNDGEPLETVEDL